jgi:hypothetical protein
MKPIEKIVLFIFVSQLFVLPEYLRGILVLNVGWGNIYPLRLYTVGLPMLYIFHLCFTRRKFKAPYLAPFLMLFVGFMIMESLPLRESPAAFSFIDMIPLTSLLFPGRGASYSFAVEQFNIYVFFLLLVNIGLSRTTFHKVIDYAVYAGLITCAVTFMGYLGFIEVGTAYRLQDVGLTERPVTLTNPNNISYICAFSILMLIIKHLNKGKLSNPYILRNTVTIFPLFIMIMINSSRGAFIIALILILYYGYRVWRFSATTRNSLHIFSILSFLAIGLFVNYQYNISSTEIHKQTKLYQRFNVDSDRDRGDWVRIVNIRNTLSNIKEHPLIGVGYRNAAITKDRYGTRSNNQFLHMLATCGCFYFLIYLFYNFKILACKLILLRRPEVMLSLIFQVIYLMLRRPTTLALIAISAYIALYFYYESRRKQYTGQAPLRNDIK